MKIQRQFKRIWYANQDCNIVSNLNIIFKSFKSSPKTSQLGRRRRRRRTHLFGFHCKHHTGEVLGRSIRTFSSPILLLIVTTPLYKPSAMYWPSFVQLNAAAAAAAKVESKLRLHDNSTTVAQRSRINTTLKNHNSSKSQKSRLKSTKPKQQQVFF